MFIDGFDLLDPVLPDPEFIEALDDRSRVEDAVDAPGDWPDSGIAELEEFLGCRPSWAAILGMLLHAPMGSDVVATLDSIPTRGLSADDAVTYLQVHDRATAWLASLQVEALVAAASPEPLVAEFTVLVPDSDREREVRIADVIRDEMAAALRRPGVVVQDEIEAARLLAGPLSETLAAARGGEISWRQVQVIAEAAERLPGHWMRDETEVATFRDGCAVLQRRALPVARRGTLSATRACVRRAVLAIDSEGEARRRREAKCLRDVWVCDDVDGMSVLMARLATEQAHAILRQVDAAAHSDLPGVEPAARIGERRAQALFGLILGSADGSNLSVEPMSQGLRVHLDVVIDLPTLLSLRSTEAGCDLEMLGSGLAELRGCGPVSVEVVRDLLADPTVATSFRRLVTDPLTGHLLDLGRTTYRVPTRLREFLVARDVTCRFPGCRRRADRGQIDHAVAWDDGGTTSLSNLGALCVRHHQLKTFGGWEIIDSQADGSCRWRSPHGREYDVRPPPD